MTNATRTFRLPSGLETNRESLMNALGLSIYIPLKGSFFQAKVGSKLFISSVECL